MIRADFSQRGADLIDLYFRNFAQELQGQVDVFGAGPPYPIPEVPGAGACRLQGDPADLRRREDGDEGAQRGTYPLGEAVPSRLAARLATRAAVAPAPTPLSTFTTERPGEQLWSMPRIAAVPSPPRP